MALLFSSDVDPPDWWGAEIKKAIPGIDFRVWPEMGAVSEIDYALVWKPEPGLLATLPNLRAIFSLGAGVDHLFSDPDLPKTLPITRVVDVNLTARMSEYVLFHVLRYHRQHDAYAASQAAGVWEEQRVAPHSPRRHPLHHQVDV